MPVNLPPVWSDGQLETDRLRAKQLFRQERMREPLEEYLDQFEDAQDAFEDLLATSVDLTQLSEKALEIVREPRLLTALRYLPGPPISADDLKVLAETTLAKKHLATNDTLALTIVKTILLGLDRRRFPWLAIGQEREPTEEERSSAILASAALLATRRVETIRRNLGKQNQEQKVKDTLRDAPRSRSARFSLLTRRAGRNDERCVRSHQPSACTGECLFLFWSHDLERLITWIETTRS